MPLALSIGLRVVIASRWILGTAFGQTEAMFGSYGELEPQRGIKRQIQSLVAQVSLLDYETVVTFGAY